MLMTVDCGRPRVATGRSPIRGDGPVTPLPAGPCADPRLGYRPATAHRRTHDGRDTLPLGIRPRGDQVPYFYAPKIPLNTQKEPGEGMRVPIVFNMPVS